MGDVPRQSFYLSCSLPAYRIFSKKSTINTVLLAPIQYEPLKGTESVNRRKHPQSVVMKSRPHIQDIDVSRYYTSLHFSKE